MPYISLTIPPGVVRGGTVYDSRGRWYDSNLVRWCDGPNDKPVLQPWGGFAVLSNATAAAVGSKPVRGLFAWRRAAGTAYIAIGTYGKLFVYTGTTLSDVTPSSSWTSGAADASGTFYARVEATSWQFDVRGEDLFAVSTADQELRTWDSSVGVGTVAATVTNSPACLACVVTPENFLVALAASGDGRLIKWADQDDTTVWTDLPSNQAGDFTLSGKGNILAGQRGRDETLIWTDTDLWAMRYQGLPLVYRFDRLGADCGAISRRSMAVIDGKALWMGTRGFYQYDGFVRPLPCDVGDFVFNRLNRAQASKICAVPNTDFGEVTWFYPSGGGTPENDSYVSYNYVKGYWSLGGLPRTAGIDRGFLEYPIMADDDGTVYEHENGTAYTDEGEGSPYTLYAESGPIEIGEGDNVMMIRQYVPDEETVGEVNTRLYTRFYPTASETTNGPYTNANPTDIRLTARQVRIRHTQVTAGWRVGTPRLEVVPGGLR